MPSTEWNSKKVRHKIIQCPCKCVNWNQDIYVRNMHVLYKVFFQHVPYCAHRTWIGSPLINFVQHTPWLPYSPASLAYLWASSFSFPIFIFRSSSNYLPDALYEGMLYSWTPRMILQKRWNWNPCIAFVKWSPIMYRVEQKSTDSYCFVILSGMN